MNISKIYPSFFLLFFLCPLITVFGHQSERDIYELRVYHIENQEQERRLDNYLENAFLPALHRAGIKRVGVFKPLLSDKEEAGKKVYVFIPYRNIDQYMELPRKLTLDKKHEKDGRDYIHAPHDKPVYKRMEVQLMRAFEGMPAYKMPGLNGPKSKRVYELRSYESGTEKLHINKVKMFNEGEIDIFDRLGFNPVFYGEVIAGANMPNLIYMTTFSDMDSEIVHWEAFRSDPQWEEMKVMEEYQNNVSRNDTRLLFPTEYSDI